MKILTHTEIRKCDQYTIAHEPIDSIDLMERAAAALTQAIMERYDRERLFVIFAGPGNNGGDALAVARRLSQQGYETQTYLFNIHQKLSADCAVNRDRLVVQCPNAVVHEVTNKFIPPTLVAGDVVIDGLFGSGLNKPLTGGFAAVVKYINRTPADVVAIDIPSGLMCEDNSQNTAATIIKAHLTLTLQMPKLSFFFAENESFLGEVVTLDIKLHPQGIAEAESCYHTTERGDLRGAMAKRSRFAHKGQFGHALLMAGHYGMAGAAILAAEACMRSGVGLLTVHTPACNNAILQTAVPEAILSLDERENVISQSIESDRFTAVAVGPGLAQADITADALAEQFTLTSTPLVLDADALNLLAVHKDWFGKLPPNTILTPHPKEFDRMVGASHSGYERLHKAKELAMERQLYIVLKGAYTAVVTPVGEIFFNTTGNPGMATAGSGDVLTGVLLAVLAQGIAATEACRLAVYVHGLAGDMAAESVGEVGMVASDIIRHLPQAWKQVYEQ